MQTSTKIDWIERVQSIGNQLTENGIKSDQNAVFVEENYSLLKELGVFTATIPMELGGAGVSHSTMCEIIKHVAQYDASTALAMSMHQHLLATMIWKYQQGKGGEETLMKIADKNLVLISTGARDWLDSNGEMRRTKGGYLMSGYKHFASQSIYGDLAVTSAPFNHETEGDQVLHFAVPMKSEGVSLLNDWDTMGMRGTGSQTIVFKDVFVPESSISLVRRQGAFHPFWNIVLGVAMPFIMSAYVGIAKKAFNITKEGLQKQKSLKPHIAYQLGEMYNELCKAEVMHKDMVALANDLKLQPVDRLGVEVLTRKTNVANACISVVSKAFDTLGGKAYYRKTGIERLFKDVQGARYHPLSEKDQQSFVGEYLLKN
ncbi:MAG: acyl-CoA/acyl-ACP dehydrogenase [Cyclobacteriaceae bacterium]